MARPPLKLLVRVVHPWALLLLALASSACSSGDEPAPTRPRRARGEASRGAAPEGRDPPPRGATRGTGDDVTLVRGSRPMMSTIYQVTVVSEDEARAQAAIEAALDEIQRLETVLSEWQEDSEISRVNAQAGGEAVLVGPDTRAVVSAGLEVGLISRGAFDISWAALRGLYLFQRGEERVPTDAEIAARLPLVGYRDVIVDEGASTVRLAREGMAIGTGGIAKGYALDRAGEILQLAGFPNYMIFGGGQVQIHGMRGSRAWRVGVQHPRQPDYIGFVESSGSSISTSGDYEHFFIDDTGRRWHHIIDLSTGRPAARSVQVTVVTERGVYADALSTACFVRGPEPCFEMLERVPGGAEAVLIDSDMRLHLSPGLRDRFVMRVELDAQGRIPMEARDARPGDVEDDTP